MHQLPRGTPVLDDPIPPEILNDCGSNLERLFALQLWGAGERTFVVQATEPYQRNTLANTRSVPCADFAWLEEKVLVECQGGLYGGRHLRPDGYRKDCIKHNNAVLDGWLPLWFYTEQIEKEETALERTIELLQQIRTRNGS